MREFYGHQLGNEQEGCITLGRLGELGSISQSTELECLGVPFDHQAPVYGEGAPMSTARVSV